MSLLKSGLLVVLAILAPIHALIISTSVLILADLFLGVWAAIKRKEVITSAGFRRSITKFAVYQVALITAFMVEVYMIKSILPVSSLVAAVIGLTELKSLLEKSYLLTGTDFKSILQKLGSVNDKK